MPRAPEIKQETRARLLAAAAREFARVGFERARVDDMTIAAGYAKGTIYNYFTSKEDLFVAVVEAAASDASARGSSTQAPTRQRLEASLEGFCAWARDNDAFARVFVRECLMGTPGLYPRVIQAEAPIIGQLESILREGIERGDVREDVSARDLALAMVGLTDLALVEHWASGGHRRTLAEIPESVLTLLLGTSARSDHRPARRHPK